MKKIEIFKIHGMHCASCSVLIHKTLERQKGVFAASANYGSEKLVLEYDPEQITIDKIKELLGKLGYTLITAEDKARLEEETEKTRVEEIKKLKKRVIVSFSFASPIILYYMAVHMFNITHIHALCFGDPTTTLFGQGTGCLTGYWFDLNWLFLVMTIPVQFYVGWPFYRNAWTALKVGSTSMDVLVVLGTSTAFFYSFFGFLAYFTHPSNPNGIGLQTWWAGFDHPFWESSAALMSFLILGRYFEAKARGGVSSAIKKLLSLQAKKAVLIRDGQEVEVEIKDIKGGDIFLVKPGEKVPADGEVIDGDSSVDEKIITGESMPVHKKAGSKVIGSTINKQGLLKCRAERVGKDTLLHQIVQMVEEAQAARAPIQDFTDRISEYFVPSVIVFALLTVAYWSFAAGWPFGSALLLGIAVLVVSCPCAMGLATPTAIMVGTGKGAEYGVILKGGEALEKTHHLNTIAFDKTGTLTKGEPAVTDVVGGGGKDQDEVLRLAAIAERGSEHPLAEAVVKGAKAKNFDMPEPKDFEALAGRGVKATVDGKEILVGNEELMKERGLAVDQYLTDYHRLQDEAKTVVFVAYDKQVIGLIAMADTLKEHAIEAIAELKKRGFEIMMITGDNERTAKAIADTIGIDRYFAKVFPDQKEALIERLQKEGKKVAMVGDGINDSPALAKADVGIAVGSGTDVAIETGSIVLIKDDLRDVVTSIDLSHRTIKKVWQNLFWAFVYNIIAIPVAAGVHLLFLQSGGEPTVAAFAFRDFISAIPGLTWLAGPLFEMTQSALRPEIAGFAMAFSSVSVVTNSLLLKRFKEPQFVREKK